jgi:hypothetical protein
MKFPTRILQLFEYSRKTIHFMMPSIPLTLEALRAGAATSCESRLSLSEHERSKLLFTPRIIWIPARRESRISAPSDARSRKSVRRIVSYTEMQAAVSSHTPAANQLESQESDNSDVTCHRSKTSCVLV